MMGWEGIWRTFCSTHPQISAWRRLTDVILQGAAGKGERVSISHRNISQKGRDFRRESDLTFPNSVPRSHLPVKLSRRKYNLPYRGDLACSLFPSPSPTFSSNFFHFRPITARWGSDRRLTVVSLAFPRPADRAWNMTDVFSCEFESLPFLYLEGRSSRWWCTTAGVL
jgi:hypothetical protein